MWAFAELGINLVAGVAGAPSVLLIGVLGEWVAALDHETLDDTVETGAVVKGFVGEFLKILHVTGRGLRPEFDHHLAL